MINMLCRRYFVFATSTTLPPPADLHERSLTNFRLRKTKGAAWAPWVWFIATIFVAASVLFYRLGASPLDLFDESRLANNALEMAKTGLSLITTYDGMPDHWNTKPPLLIWLMSISIRVFGPNEWAVRLPSAVAALATVTLMFAFCNFRLRRPFAGFAAVVVLLGSYYYIQFHAARSGDYDATLALWTTGYLLAGYMFTHDHPSKRRQWLLLCAVGIVLAFLTKTVEGLIFLPALLIYAMLQGRIVEIFRLPIAYVSGTIVLLICVGYYFWREQIDPGYLAAVMQNDLLGRYMTDGGGGSFFFYFLPLLVKSLLFAGFQFQWGRGERRQISVFLGLMSLFFLVIISLSHTKRAWYAVPLLPPSAMVIGVGLDEVLEWIAMRWRRFRIIINGTLVSFCVFASLGVIGQNARFVALNEKVLIADDRNLTSLFLRDPIVQYGSPQKFVVIQESFPRSQSDLGDPSSFYVAPTLFYVNALRATGHIIEILPPSASIPAGFNAVVMCGAMLPHAATAQTVVTPILIAGKCGIYQLIAK
jgi:4-amino-4-deoxy-L-arabinose transferase-like glycosyltransferase